MYFIRHILRFFSRTLPARFSRRNALIVAVDHPLHRKAALKALARLVQDLKGHPLLRLFRLRKRLRLRPHGVRLELQILPPWPRLLAMPLVSRLTGKTEDLLYYLQRRFRMHGLSFQNGASPVERDFNLSFPTSLSADCLYLSTVIVDPLDWAPTEERTLEGRAFDGPDMIPFHLGRGFRLFGGLKGGGHFHQRWYEALLFAGNRRWEGFLIKDSSSRLADIFFGDSGFQARFQDRKVPAGGVLRRPCRTMQLIPVSWSGFPHLPFDGRDFCLFLVDGSLRIQIFKCRFLDPVNHRLHVQGRPLPFRRNALQRIFDLQPSESDLPENGTYVYTSSVALEMEKLESVDILDCDYRKASQIGLKTAAAPDAIVYGRN